MTFRICQGKVYILTADVVLWEECLTADTLRSGSNWCSTINGTQTDGVCVGTSTEQTRRLQLTATFYTDTDKHSNTARQQ